VWYGRPRQISEGIDAILADPSLGAVTDPDRIAVIGHSAGGYTALALIGGRADMDRARSHCRQHPHDGFCEVRVGQTRVTAPSVPIPDSRDARIKAAIPMAPPGILLDPVSLTKVGVPVRICAAEFDAAVPARYHAGPLRQTIKPTPEFVLVRGPATIPSLSHSPKRSRSRLGRRPPTLRASTERSFRKSFGVKSRSSSTAPCAESPRQTSTFRRADRPFFNDECLAGHEGRPIADARRPVKGCRGA
jgi:predicted dienelactone hydrolase